MPPRKWICASGDPLGHRPEGGCAGRALSLGLARTAFGSPSRGPAKPGYGHLLKGAGARRFRARQKIAKFRTAEGLERAWIFTARAILLRRRHLLRSGRPARGRIDSEIFARNACSRQSRRRRRFRRETGSSQATPCDAEVAQRVLHEANR